MWELFKLFGDKTLAESMRAIIIVFLGILVCITFLYYVACWLLGTATSGSDVANIFVASATLLGPIILVFTLYAWKDQEKTKALSSCAIESSILTRKYLKKLLLITVFTKAANHHYSITEQNNLIANLEELKDLYLELCENLWTLELYLSKEHTPDFFKKFQRAHESLYFTYLALMTPIDVAAGAKHRNLIKERHKEINTILKQQHQEFLRYLAGFKS